MSHPIEFSLFAPYNKSAMLKGSFSQWREIPMTKGRDGVFRVTVDLEDGVYEYKFKVRTRSWFFEPDSWVDVTDPYATDVTGDKAYENAVARIVGGKRVVDGYVWKHDDKPLPPDEDLVIYELHVSDFSGGEDDPYMRGQFRHVAEKLDYLSDLGVTALELLPVKEYPGDYSWGYNPRHFFAPETSYGSTADLKRLVDECHARGMRVIIDGIYDHAEASAPLTQIDHDYWFHHEPKDPEFNWGPQFNYEHFDQELKLSPAWKFIGEAVRFWITEYHFDGIRYDAARHIENFDFLHWIAKEAKDTAGVKPFYNVAEHLPETPAVTNQDGPMDGCWHDTFYWVMRDLLCGRAFDMEKLKDVLDARRRGFLGPTNVVNYLSNHDHDRLLAELGDAGILDEEAFRRAALGATLLFTAMGVPLVWMGEEFGECKKKTEGPAKIDWNLLRGEHNRGLREHYRRLAALRRECHALRTANVAFFHEDPSARVLAFVRWNDVGARVVVVASFSPDPLVGYQVHGFPADGQWLDWSRSGGVEVHGGTLALDFKGFEARVFIWP